MPIDQNVPTTPIAGPVESNAPTAPPLAKAPEDSAGFRLLIESLERLAEEHRTAPPVADAISVQDAVARADEGFTLAMDLRRQLEDAFRQRIP